MESASIAVRIFLVIGEIFNNIFIMEQTKAKFSKLTLVMLCFFVMGLVDLVGIA